MFLIQYLHTSGVSVVYGLSVHPNAFISAARAMIESYSSFAADMFALKASWASSNS